MPCDSHVTCRWSWLVRRCVSSCHSCLQEKWSGKLTGKSQPLSFAEPSRWVERSPPPHISTLSPHSHLCHYTHSTPSQDDEGKWQEDEEQTLRLKTNYIVSAFGSGLTDDDGGWGNTVDTLHKHHVAVHSHTQSLRPSLL